MTFDCQSEFGEHEHADENEAAECQRIIDTMVNGYDFDPMDDIPWGTPDSWIPDNPNEDGFRLSDFVEQG